MRKSMAWSRWFAVLASAMLLPAFALAQPEDDDDDDDDDERTHVARTVYQYSDASGAIHLVDHLDQVPQAYRSPGLFHEIVQMERIPGPRDEFDPDTNPKETHDLWLRQKERDAQAAEAETTPEEPPSPPLSPAQRHKQLEDRRIELLEQLTLLEEGSAAEARQALTEAELVAALAEAEAELAAIAAELEALGATGS